MQTCKQTQNRYEMGWAGNTKSGNQGDIWGATMLYIELISIYHWYHKKYGITNEKKLKEDIWYVWV